MKVLLAGTFDVLHPGHIALIRRAKRKFRGETYVIVARDSNVRRFKGRPPVMPENVRAFIIANLKPVDHVLIGSKDILFRIREIKPDVIVLGHDQPISEERLRKKLDELGLDTLIVRAPKFFSDRDSSTKVKKRIRERCERYIRFLS